MKQKVRARRLTERKSIRKRKVTMFVAVSVAWIPNVPESAKLNEKVRVEQRLSAVQI